jgi:hypothetical protein
VPDSPGFDDGTLSLYHTRTKTRTRWYPWVHGYGYVKGTGMSRVRVRVDVWTPAGLPVRIPSMLTTKVIQTTVIVSLDLAMILLRA